MPDSPVQHARFNVGSIVGNADIFASAFTAKQDGYLHIECQFATAAVLQRTETSGGTTITGKVNRGNALAAGCIETFTMLCTKGHTYNFQPATTVVVDSLKVHEVSHAAGA